MSTATKGRGIALLVLCVTGALALWFSATAVVPSLIAAHGLSQDHAALLTNAVQVGFVAGTLSSAVLGLADRIDSRHFFAAATLTGTAANALLLVLDPAGFGIIVCRFVTGAAMAGVYPVGMKMATTWARPGGRSDMGLLVGTVVGAVVLGSGLPHLFNALGGVDWRHTVGGASVAAGLAALLIFAVPLGPNQRPSPPFDAGAALAGFRDPALRLANLGYLGHMWELYAMWAWLGVFLVASFGAAGLDDADTWARAISFLSIGVTGGFGCVVAGAMADRWGRTTVTIGAMIISGACCLIVGFLFGGPPWLVTVVVLIWGATVVADSAQFSTSIAELAPPDRIGTLLTIQTAAGFLLTMVTIQVMPLAVEWLTWRYAFAILAIGPALGILAMARLRHHPDAAKLAGGNR